METNKIRLGEIATYVNGYAFKPKDRGNVGLPIVRLQDLTGNARDVGFYNGEYPKKIEINNGDILISWSASLGVYVWNKGKALLNQHIFRVVFDKGEIDKSFFVYAVRQKLKEMGTKTHGATMKHIVKKDFDAIEIPYPQINRQIEIARNMDKISSVIEKKERQLKLLDDLIQARFVEMFGDPIRNTQNRPTTKLINVVKMQRGFDLPVQDRNQDGNIPVYGANGVLDSHNTARIHGGGVITGRSGTIGKVFYTEGDYWPLNTSLFSVDKHGNNVIYLAYLLQMFDLTRFVEGTGVPTLNRNMFHNRQIIDVPINEQNQFAAFVQQVNKSKFVIHKFLYCFIDNKQSIIKPRLNTKESGKIRGGKPHADEF